MDLFGTGSVISTFDLPSHLNDLCSRLPIGTSYTSDNLIQNHTLFPYYAPFLPSHRAKKVKEMMKGSNGSGIHASIGIMASSTGIKSTLFFCLKCYEMDIFKYGEPYWHRTHQLPGVYICPAHNEILMSLDSLEFNRHVYLSLPIQLESVKYGPSIKNEILKSSKIIDVLSNLAQDSERLLAQGNFYNLYFSKSLYLSRLKQLGYVTINELIRQAKLFEQFHLYFGEDTLNFLDCSLKGDSTWITLVTRKARRFVHPVKSLLFIRFLYGSLQECMNHKSHFHPFGDGPWPCLNRAADHYGKKVITDCHITACSDTRRPVGTFSCECGFVYSRRGPDQDEQDKYKIGRIKSFGELWINRLDYLISEERISYRTAAKILGVDPKTVIKYANRFNNQSENKKVNIKTLTYKKNDKGQDIPVKPQRKEIKPKQRVNWELRDLEISILIEEECKKMLNSTEKPIRITLSNMARRIGLSSLLFKKKNILPVSMSILDKYQESIEAFQIRRIHWVTKQLNEWPIKRWKIEKLAGLRPRYSNLVNDEINKLIISTPLSDCFPESEANRFCHH